jgi:GPH family glycoside/pentoside/hexuronide:cation symporter
MGDGVTDSVQRTEESIFPAQEAASLCVVPDRLTIRAILLYSVGEIPVTITMVVMGLFTVFFYNSVMGLPGALTGVGVFAGLLVDAVLDPYIGFRSDRSRSRLGRRHVFMLAGATAIGPSFFMLFRPPSGLNHIALFLWLLAFSILFRTASAVYRIPYLSLGAELTDDYHERTRVIAIRAVLGLIGTLAAASLSVLLFFRASGRGEPKLVVANYHHMGAWFGAVLTVAGLLAAWGTRGFVSTAAPQIGRSIHEFFGGFRIAFSNSSFRTLWLSSTIFFNAVVVNATLAVHFLTWYVLISDAKAISGIQTSLYVGALAGVFGWMRLSRVLEKRTLCLIGMVGAAVLLGAASLLTGVGHPFGVGNVGALMIGNTLGGMFVSCLWVLPSSMLADVADEDELQTGTRREGMFFGILNFGEKVAAGGGMLLTGVLLNYFVHLKPGNAVQSPAAVARVGALYGLLPAAIGLVGALCIRMYKLDETRVRRIQKELRHRRARGAIAE